MIERTRVPADEPTPTVGGIVRAALGFGREAVCLVRAKSHEAGPALCVVLTTAAAVRAVGPGLLKLFAEVPPSEASKKLFLQLDTVSPVCLAFEWMDSNRQDWRWAELVVTPPITTCPSKVIVVLVRGLGS